MLQNVFDSVDKDLRDGYQQDGIAMPLYVSAKPMFGFDQVPAYLSKELGSANLYLLQEMVSMSVAGDKTAGESRHPKALIELFGGHIQPVSLVNQYKMRVKRSKTKTAFGVKWEVHDVEIHYRNNLGMKWVQAMQLAGGGVGAGASAKTGKGPKAGSVSQKWVDGHVAKYDNVYWAPEQFEGSYMSGGTKAGAECSLAGGGATLEAEAELLFVQFMHGGNHIQFVLTADETADASVDVKKGLKNVAKGAMKGKKPGAVCGAEFGVNASTGYARTTEEAKATATPVPQEQVIQYDGTWRPLMTELLYCDTADYMPRDPVRLGSLSSRRPCT